MGVRCLAQGPTVLMIRVARGFSPSDPSQRRKFEFFVVFPKDRLTEIQESKRGKC